MLNKIWPIFIIVSIVFAIFNGNITNVNNSILDSTKTTVYLCLDLLGAICLWNGIMSIASETTLLDKLAKFLSPLINKLFPDFKKNKKIKSEVSMNMIANILGLGNAATPLGIKAITSMQEENPKKDTLSDSMMMLIVVNTASLQLIPTTVIAIRNSLGSQNPTSIIFPVWVATIAAAIAGVIATKIIIKISKKSKG